MIQRKETFSPLMPSASIEHGRSFDSDQRSTFAATDVARYRGEADERARSPGDRPPSGDEPEIGLAVDLLIRTAGLLGIGLSALACYTLYHLLHRGTPAEPTLGQYGLAAVTFLGASIGSGLLVLGRHIHDRIEVAERWRRRW